jgi:hypothetical protein
MHDTPQLGLPLIEAAQAQKHVTHNEALTLLDALAQIAVETMNATTPPPDAQDGSRFHVGPAGEGAFAGRANQIALRDAGAWRFLSPRAGWLAWSLSDGAPFVFDGSQWVALGAVLRRLQNLERLGVGTAADEANPLSAKVNAALFTARFAGESGTGDLRFTLNKESAPRTVSQLYQSDWSGRAETGLIGDDHYRIKVSPDGSNWIDALEVDNASGQARHVAGTPAAPGQSFIGDPDTGVSNPGANELGLVAGGAERIRVNAVGLGVGTPAPNASLHVVGDAILMQGAAPHLRFFRPDGLANEKFWDVIHSGGLLQHRAINDGYTDAQSYLVAERSGATIASVSLLTGGQSRLHVSPLGNLGVGTTGPDNFFGVPHRLAISGASDSGILAVVHNSATGAGAAASWRLIGGTPNSFVDSTLEDGNGAPRLRHWHGSSIGFAQWIFDGQPRVTFTREGAVGIGTTEPSTTLHVAGPIRCGAYARETVPSAAAVGAGTTIWVSNPQSGAARAFWSNGTDWRDQANFEP